MQTEFLFLPPQTVVTRAWANRLRAAFPTLTVHVAEDVAQAIQVIQHVDAIYGTLPADLLGRTQRLRWLQAPQAAPPAGFYYPELIAHPLVVTNFREIYNDHLGAHIMALVLSFARGFHTYIPRQAARKWQPLPLDTGVVHLPEAKALIVGVGGIGSETARLAKAFGMHVIGIDARRTDMPAGVDELYHSDRLDENLHRADFVILTIPHTPKTAGIMNRARFQQMKPGAFFINVGRGKTTVLSDLVDALRSGHLAGAGLDVFEEEPLPSDHPLWTMPGVLLTPHVAGYGPHLDERRYEILAYNCQALLEGGLMRNVVDKANWF
ncbi:D-2-hydroxyacid dehydrogenase [soil metagenome]